jgi:hypothetical protein
MISVAECVHRWAPGGRCETCRAKRCNKWHCDNARLPAASRCAEHAPKRDHPAAPPAPALHERRERASIRVTIYSWPAPRR